MSGIKSSLYILLSIAQTNKTDQYDYQWLHCTANHFALCFNNRKIMRIFPHQSIFHSRLIRAETCRAAATHVCVVYSRSLAEHDTWSSKILKTKYIVFFLNNLINR